MRADRSHGLSSFYSLPSRILHYLALQFSSVLELSFDLERRLNPIGHLASDAVCITGLARSGTTALLQAIYESGEFASLTYRDMPFPLAPNTWAKIARKRKHTGMKVERLHSDGLMINLNSPEAFEEVFWRLYYGDQYIQADHLASHEVSSSVIDRWRIFQNVVCSRYKKSRYLAKNNNMILRMASICAQHRAVRFLIVFRDPAAHISSLLRQHNNFLNIRPFVARYMQWLGHHEFGVQHKPYFCVPAEGTDAAATEPSYWLERWTDYYRSALDIIDRYPQSVIPVSADRWQKDSVYRGGLAKLLNIESLESLANRAAPMRDAFRVAESGISQISLEIHRELERRAESSLRVR